jgi:hypothetical protein
MTRSMVRFREWAFFGSFCDVSSCSFLSARRPRNQCLPWVSVKGLDGLVEEVEELPRDTFLVCIRCGAQNQGEASMVSA